VLSRQQIPDTAIRSPKPASSPAIGHAPGRLLWASEVPTIPEFGQPIQMMRVDTMPLQFADWEVSDHEKRWRNQSRLGMAIGGMTALGGLGAYLAGWTKLGGSMMLAGGLGAKTSYDRSKRYGRNPLDELIDYRKNKVADKTLLADIIDEMLADKKTTISYGESGHPGGETRKTKKGYEVVLDGSFPIEDEMQAVLHELTHVRADQVYTQNQEGEQFANIHKEDPIDIIGNLAEDFDKAQTLAEKGKGLNNKQKNHIIARLKRADKVHGNEYDTVVNELLLYAHQQGLDNKVPVVDQIEDMAKKAFGRRNP